MTNNRAYFQGGSVMGPGEGIYLATKSDTVDDPNGPFRGICFDAAGAIKVTTLEGVAVTIPSGVLAAGVIHPLAVRRIWSSVTTATNIHGVV